MADLIDFLTDAISTPNLADNFRKMISDDSISGAQISTWLESGAEQIVDKNYVVSAEDCDRLRELYNKMTKGADPYVIVPRY